MTSGSKVTYRYFHSRAQSLMVETTQKLDHPWSDIFRVIDDHAQNGKKEEV